MSYWIRRPKVKNEIMKIEKRKKVPPLRKRDGDCEEYFRRGNVEAELDSLHQLPIETVAERAELLDSDDANYMSSEAVLHFVRQSKAIGDSLPFRTLFKVLRQRVLKAVPVSVKRLDDGKVGEDAYQLEVRERVVKKFMEILCLDRKNGYDGRLDYYEAMFNSAMRKLRLTAQAATSTRREREKSVPVVIDEAISGKGDDFGAILENLNEPADSGNSVYRFELLSAINNLPDDDERRVIELLIQGYLLKEVAEIVECTEKTARTRRNKARAALAEVLGREDLL